MYPYKGLTPIDMEEISFLSKEICKQIPKNVDLIFTVETDGILTALPVSIELKKPLISARIFNYRIENFYKLVQETGYSKRDLFFSFDPKRIRRVAIVDCILSTGGTIKASVELFEKLGVEVSGIFTVINKINYTDADFLESISDKFYSIFDVEVKNGKILVNKSVYNRALDKKK